MEPDAADMVASCGNVREDDDAINRNRNHYRAWAYPCQHRSNGCCPGCLQRYQSGGSRNDADHTGTLLVHMARPLWPLPSLALLVSGLL
jgi:hypothetical protein